MSPTLLLLPSSYVCEPKLTDRVTQQTQPNKVVASPYNSRNHPQLFSASPVHEAAQFPEVPISEFAPFLPQLRRPRLYHGVCGLPPRMFQGGDQLIMGYTFEEGSAAGGGGGQEVLELKDASLTMVSSGSRKVV